MHIVTSKLHTAIISEEHLLHFAIFNPMLTKFKALLPGATGVETVFCSKRN